MSGVPLPRQLVRASAGTGKTYTISSRIVGLLASGAEPDRVLASTFTRKAAGEILDRVLYRLAEACLDPEAARKLARDATMPGAESADGLGNREDALRLLEMLSRSLHRIDVGTLDALFVRTARSFAPELGMPPGWTIADPPLEARLRAEALHEVLGAGERAELVGMVRRIARQPASRRVYDRLEDQADALLSLERQLDPGADDPWSPFRVVDRPEDPSRARDRLADRLAAVEPPLKDDGTPYVTWENALDDAVAAIREERWEDLWRKGVGKKLREGEQEFSHNPIPPEVAAIHEEARMLARASLAREYDEQARAMGRFARRYEQGFLERQRELGAYRFGDVTHLLGAGDTPITAREDFSYRLDRRAAHVLLDEFQDTALGQWEVLRPLLDRVASAPREEGSLVVVADTKQSIYGWRGADPRLVDRVAERYGLGEETLDRSWRSSPTVLDFVNGLFENVADNPVLEGVDRGPGEAGRWARAFGRHHPAEPREDEPGHVTVDVGPNRDPEGMMALAARRAARLHEEVPAARIGVLTYRNVSVARVIHELRLLGVEASEEGGTPVDDAAPVAALLALLRLADHPGDTIARYHVAATPLGEIVGLSDRRDERTARSLSLSVRRRLLDEGYGSSLAEWARALAPRVSPTEMRRLEQLVELGYRWDERSTLRPGDFARFVRSEKVEDPLASPVRVMTVHQAKGLEFDAVVLPELDRSIAGTGSGPALPERDPDTGRVLRVFPRIPRHHRHLFPEVEEAVRQEQCSLLRDALSFLYVAVTRARYSLHLLIQADPESSISSASSLARLVRASLGHHERRVEDGERLFEAGEAGWHREIERIREARAATADASDGETGPLRVTRGARRERILGRVAPSDLASDGRVELADRLRVDRDRAYALGTVVHAWCEEVRWIEQELPADTRLVEIARRTEPSLTDDDIERHLEWFRHALEAPEVRRALSREATADRCRGSVEVRTERRFSHRRGGEIVTGSIDRLVLIREDGGNGTPTLDGERSPIVSAEVLDFKTDEVDAGPTLEEKVGDYEPQIALYREAVASMYGLDPGAVTARLVFLAPGVVREV